MNYRILVALFLGVVCLSAQAEQRWFEVELLIFQRNVEIKDMSEQLSSQEITLNTENSISLLEPIRRSDCIEGVACLSKANPTVITSAVFNQEASEFQRLERSKLQLVQQRQLLEDHASFNPVFHMVWRMPVLSGRTAKPIHLFAGENLAFGLQKRQLENSKLNVNENETPLTGLTYQTVATPTAEFSDVALSIDLTEPATIITDKWAIDGNFKIYLDHYLYIDSQLIIRKEVTEDVQQVEQIVDVIDDENGVQIATQVNDNIMPEIKQRTVIKEILFDQNRRLRSEEIHYMDHPLMGIIVQIRKIPKEELDEELQTID